MSKIHSLYTSFNNGVITPRALGRSRLDKYTSSLLTCTNFLPTVYGGLYNRTGTQYIAEAASNTDNVRFLPFEASDTESYILELSDGFCRVIKNEQLVRVPSPITNGTFDSDIDGWTDESGDSSSISYEDSTLKLTGTNAKAVMPVIPKAGISTFTLTLDVLDNDVLVRAGTTSSNTEAANTTVSVGTGQTVQITYPSSVNSEDMYIYIESTVAGDTFIDNVSLDSPIYIFPIVYSHTDLIDIGKPAQSNDILIVPHPNYFPRQITRYGDSAWRMTELAITDGPYLDENVVDTDFILSSKAGTTITPSDVEGDITMTSSTSLFKDSDVGRLIRYKGTTEDTDEVVFAGTGLQSYFDIPFYPKTAEALEVVQVYGSGERVPRDLTTHYTIENDQVRMNYNVPTGDLLIVRRKDAGSGEWGYARITSVTNDLVVNATVVERLDSTNASTEWKLGAWSDSTGYPSQCLFHQQRLIFANTYAEPLTVWGSRTFDFTNFSPDNIFNLGTPDSDTSYTFPLASNSLDSIQWLSGQRVLIIGTVNNVYTMTGSSTDAAITPTSVNVQKQVAIGSEPFPVIQVENKTIIIKKLGREINSLSYEFASDGYGVNNLSLFSEHLGTRSTFKQIVYTETPNKIFWVTHQDGGLSSVTYLPNQDVVGWAEHRIGGTDTKIIEMGSLPSTIQDRLYLVVERTIDGETKRYLEFITDDFNQDNKEDAKYSDSLYTYSGDSTSTITGLDHLEGEVVSILANGNIHPDKTVSEGSIELDYNVTKAQIGLSYSSLMETVPIEAGLPFGTTQMTIQRVLEAGIDFLDSLNVKYGYRENKLDLLTFRSPSDNMDSGPPLFTGTKIVEFPHGQELSSKIIIQQDQPLPIHVRAIVLKLQVTDK